MEAFCADYPKYLHVKMFLGAKRALLTNAKYMGPRPNLRLSVLYTTSLDLCVSYSCSNPIFRAVAYLLGFGKVHETHFSEAGQSNLI